MNDFTDFMHELHVLSHMSEQIAHEYFFGPAGITGQQFGILKSIALQGGQAESISCICVHTTAGNMTGIVSRMVRDGLLDRIEDKDDRRKKILTLTSKGKKIYLNLEKAFKKKGKVLQKMLVWMDMDSLTRDLQKIQQLLSTNF